VQLGDSPAFPCGKKRRTSGQYTILGLGNIPHKIGESTYLKEIFYIFNSHFSLCNMCILKHSLTLVNASYRPWQGEKCRSSCSKYLRTTKSISNLRSPSESHVPNRWRHTKLTQSGQFIRVTHVPLERFTKICDRVSSTKPQRWRKYLLTFLNTHGKRVQRLGYR